MRLNSSFIGPHPAKSGYVLDFFVNDNDPVDFQSGSGSFTVNLPDFAITGVIFEGKNSIFETGVTLNNINPVVDAVHLTCLFSGDLDGVTGKAVSNIRKVAVYTGVHPSFQPDIINFTNRVSEFNLASDLAEAFALIQVDASELQNRYNENLFYKTIPLDYLTFGGESVAVSGEMFSGFAANPTINETEVLISRENAKDLEFFQAEGVIDIFTGTSITLKSGIPSDFYAEFRIRTNTEEISISGSGLPLVSSINGLTVSSNAVTIPTGNQFSEFAIDMLLDSLGQIESFIILDG
ncbi:MAG: hypothetical protein ACO3HJ_00240 [Methylophilaceae bacterium]